jgi:polar amino acid transport system substrate-binding protein
MFNPRSRNALLVTGSALALAVGVSGCSAGGSPAGAAPNTSPKDSASTGTTIAVAQLDSKLHDALPADVKTNGYLTLATDPTDPPLEFYGASNDLIGSEVDLSNAIGQVLGVKIRLVPTKFDSIIPGIQSGRYDASMSGFADRPERQKVVDFVDYFTSSRGYLIKAGTHPGLAAATDLCGMKVAVAKGTTMADSIVTQGAECVAKGKAAIDSQIYPDQSACVLAVQSARADLTILSDHAALWIAKQSTGALDVVLKAQEGKDINGIAIKKGGLTEPIHQAIQKLMDDGTFQQIFTKWGLEKIMLTKATVNAGV